MLTTQSKPYELTPAGIIWRRALQPEEFSELIGWLRIAREAVHWWVGDALLYGDEHMQGVAEQLVDASDWEESTVRVYTSVCARVPMSNRLARVPFGHYVNGLAALPLDEQRAWAERVERESLTQAQLRTALRLDSRREAYDLKHAGLPSGLFRLGLATPPWEFDDAGSITREASQALMPIADLCALPVGDLFEDDAVLGLWVPAPLLYAKPGPREVLDAWGFTCRDGMVWDKVMHHADAASIVSTRHEHFLICTRGSCAPDAPTPMPESIYRARGELKPAHFRQTLERLYPIGSRVDLFGRQPVAGWTLLGRDLGLRERKSA